MRYVDLGVAPYKRDQGNNRKKKILKFGIAALLLGIVLYGGYLFYWPISQLINEIFRHPGLVLSFIRDPLSDLESTDGRTNVLLLGIDKRSSVPYSYKDSQGTTHKGGFLTDTIIVLSVGKETKDAAMVSIPRDTWVDIPSWDNFSGGAGKINSVYSVGNTQGYPEGGLELIKKVVSQNLGIPIHYAIRIDFEGFEKTIDTLGGIEVTVDKTFDDYQYPVEGQETATCSDKTYSCRYRHVHFDKGPQKMDGKTALEFVRSRTGTAGEGSDFARAARQQKVLIAARDKALSLENLLAPGRIRDLFKDFGESIETDFDLSAYPGAYKLLKEVDTSTAKKLVLSPEDGMFYTPNPGLYGGAYVLLPKGDDWSKIQEKVKDLLFSNSTNQ